MEVHVNTKVLEVADHGIRLIQEFITAHSIVLAAGNAGSPLPFLKHNPRTPSDDK